jgi:hypothetical protein
MGRAGILQLQFADLNPVPRPQQRNVYRHPILERRIGSLGATQAVADFQDRDGVEVPRGARMRRGLRREPFDPAIAADPEPCFHYRRFDAHKVAYDGRQLIWPWGEDDFGLRNAEDRARWLTDWLNKMTGLGITAKPVLALPGWYGS